MAYGLNFMNKVLSVEQAIEKSKELREQGKRIVLAGGCFDILHIGHIRFLEKAKEQGDVLFLLLEADETIKKYKGSGRPINHQEDRARIAASLLMVDFVVNLPPLPSDTFYDEVINEIKPAIIATTAGDAQRRHKERQAEAIGGKVVDVVLPIEDQSTSRIVKLLEEL